MISKWFRNLSRLLCLIQCYIKFVNYTSSLSSGGLTNYLYICSLPSGVRVPDNIPERVLLRVYGDIARSSTFTVQNSVIFALMSEKQLGPKLHGMNPEARIEELVPVS